MKHPNKRCPICNKRRAYTAHYELLKTCGRPVCVSALKRRNATEQNHRRRMRGSWIGLAYYLDQPVPPPEGEFPIQDTPTDCFSFSNC